MSLTVTATQGGASANGLLLRVKVLTGVAATQNGATASAAATCSVSITTTVTGSRVYGAVSNGAGIAADASTTLIDNFTDSTNSEVYGSFKATSATGTPGAVAVGASGGDAFGDVAAVEILASGTITEDASGPVVVTTMTATTVTTASFTPPPGALLVAMIGSDGAANGSTVTTMTVTGGGLTWTQAAHAATPGSCYAGVWTAQVPAASNSGAFMTFPA